MAIALLMNIGAISATTSDQSNVSLNQTVQAPVQNSVQITNKNTSSSIKDSPSNTTTKQTYAAAGTVKTPVTLTQASINSAASKLQTYIKTNHKLPSSITISGQKITLSQFLYLLTADLLKVNAKSKSSITLKSVNTPILTVSETFKNGNLTKTEYNSIAKKVYDYINVHNTAPITSSSSFGLIRYESLIYTYSKILGFYGTTKRLPAYVAIQRGMVSTPTIKVTTAPSTPVVIPADILPYLDPTNNCQSDNALIKSTADSITAGLTNQTDKATAIFNWVRDNIQYSFYYNTKYGALGTLNSKTANCVDTSHLMIALMRASGIPAEYEHVNAQFTSGTWYGHVIALVYINGVWYKADGTSSNNQFGVVNNWNTTTATILGTYKELPF
jgi:hypothetical protein